MPVQYRPSSPRARRGLNHSPNPILSNLVVVCVARLCLSLSRAVVPPSPSPSVQWELVPKLFDLHTMTLCSTRERDEAEEITRVAEMSPGRLGWKEMGIMVVSERLGGPCGGTNRDGLLGYGLPSPLSSGLTSAMVECESLICCSYCEVSHGGSSRW